MKLFGWLKKPKNKLDVKQYIKDANAVSRPTVILFTLAILFICAAVVFSLFLGGRWIYRRATSDDSNQASTEQVESNEDTVPESPAIETTLTAPTSTNTPNTGPEIPNTGPQPE